MDAKHCLGCEDDFYNGKNPYDVKSCWLRADAKRESRLLIHVDQAPPYLNLKPELRPTCYKRSRFVTVKPESIGKDGYWKTR